MISRVEGVLESVDDGRATVRCGPFALEVHVSAATGVDLVPRVGREVRLQTMPLLESQGQGSSFVPRLLGFATETDRAFFELFTTVKGIGPRKALRALARPSSAIATAIVEGDVPTLTGLPEIGKRTAQTIIAELGGKVDAWAVPGAAPVEGSAGAIPVATGPAGRLPTPAARDAAAVLEQLGESASGAENLVARAIAANPELDDAAAIIEVAYRARETPAAS